MKRPSRRKLFVLSALLASTALFAVARWVIVPYRIRGGSMLPTLVGEGACGGDIVLVNRLAYLTAGPKRWEVAISRHDAEAESVKRVAGLPGETVEIREGKLLIDGAAVEPPPELHDQYIVQKGHYGFAPVRLGPEQYFLLGDASYSSSDSRRWGPVNRADIDGRVLAVVQPWSRVGWVR